MSGLGLAWQGDSWESGFWMKSNLEILARALVQRLHNAGHIAYYAGGCVRDALLGKDPHDYDIATDALPEDVQRIFNKTVAVGAHFGVICVIEDGQEFQVATFRSDGAYRDGRHPESVAYSSPQQDALRRDFTVNGMFYDPLAGEVIDYVGGRADLEARVLRAVGDPVERFKEDRLRLLRAVRFATVLGLEWDPATWAAVRAASSEIREVSAERIREELVRIFLSPERVRGFDLLDESGLLRAVLPELELLKGCEQPPQFHPEGDVFVHTRRMLELLPSQVSLALVLSVLFHDIGKPGTLSRDADGGRIRFNGHDRLGAGMTEVLMERLRFSRRDIEPTVEAVAQHMVFKDVQQMRVARLKRFMSRETFEDELELHRVDCQSSHGMLDNYHFLKAKREEFGNEPLIPKPLITGRELIALGLKPGPQFKEVLEAVESRQLEGVLRDRDQALEFVRGAYLGEKGPVTQK
jgi:tRNA nucleotidyltransferase/poly(A) polymerase